MAELPGPTLNNTCLCSEEPAGGRPGIWATASHVKPGQGMLPALRTPRLCSGGLDQQDGVDSTPTRKPRAALTVSEAAEFLIPQHSFVSGRPSPGDWLQRPGSKGAQQPLSPWPQDRLASRSSNRPGAAQTVSEMAENLLGHLSFVSARPSPGGSMQRPGS